MRDVGTMTSVKRLHETLRKTLIIQFINNSRRMIYNIARYSIIGVNSYHTTLAQIISHNMREIVITEFDTKNITVFYTQLSQQWHSSYHRILYIIYTIYTIQ
jgi:hypothetical protein